jgi:thioredoxin 1
MAGKVTKIFIVSVLIVAVCGIIAYKHIKNTSSSSNNTQAAIDINQKQISRAEPQSLKALPRLVDLGADKCIPCKMMAPILEELKKEYEGRLQVEFIDVWKNPDEIGMYGIRLIPTQIFFDASGRELFRHEGFYSRENILGRWKELGVEFAEAE